MGKHGVSVRNYLLKNKINKQICGLFFQVIFFINTSDNICNFLLLNFEDDFLLVALLKYPPLYEGVGCTIYSFIYLLEK